MKRKEMLHIYDGYIFMREEILLMTKKMKNNLYIKKMRATHTIIIYVVLDMKIIHICAIFKCV